MDVPARLRFARYRGLKSFNYSSWDPKENLPSDYSRIFQFENFNRTKRRVLKMEPNEETSAPIGSFVKITIRNVPVELKKSLDESPGRPLVIFGLLRHENKLSVVNLLLKKHSSFEAPIKSKEKLIFHVGCRRFFAQPIFSAHTNGSKFKYERFLRDDAATVASVYAPITYPPSSVVVFKLNTDGSQSLVATGSILSINPDRIIAKRIILSGHPFKISKRAAVVRYMFFNREDILWFKPVEIRTKYGRRGHIKEPLGTHGHMKCYFDRQINSMDTVLMSLYKRVFPKWVIDERVPDPVYSQDPDDYDKEMY
jgi:pre-rRNA-processing protein TSR1